VSKRLRGIAQSVNWTLPEFVRLLLIITLCALRKSRQTHAEVFESDLNLLASYNSPLVTCIHLIRWLYETRASPGWSPLDLLSHNSLMFSVENKVFIIHQNISSPMYRELLLLKVSLHTANAAFLIEPGETQDTIEVIITSCVYLS
jgi:hypothetical protein